MNQWCELLVSHRAIDRPKFTDCVKNLLIVLYKNPTSSSCDILRCRESSIREIRWEVSLVDFPWDEYYAGTRPDRCLWDFIASSKSKFARISNDFDEEANYFTVRCCPVYTASVHLQCGADVPWCVSISFRGKFKF